MRFELARFEGDLERDTGDVPASIAAFERALGHAGDDAQRCNAMLGIVAAHRATGSAEAGLAVLDRAEPLAAAADLAREASRAAYLRGCFEFARGDARASQRAQERCARGARAARDAECEAQALSGLADVLYPDGRMRSAHAAFEECVALCDREGLTRFSLDRRCMLRIVHAYLEPADAAVPELDRVRAAARDFRQRSAEVMADESEGWVRVRGPLRRRDRAYGAQPRAAREIGSRRWIVFDLGILTYAYWNVDRRAEAAGALREAFAVGEETGLRFVGGMLHGARAQMVEDPGDLAGVLAAGEASLEAGAPRAAISCTAARPSMPRCGMPTGIRAAGSGGAGGVASSRAPALDRLRHRTRAPACRGRARPAGRGRAGRVPRARRGAAPAGRAARADAALARCGAVE